MQKRYNQNENSVRQCRRLYPIKYPGLPHIPQQHTLNRSKNSVSCKKGNVQSKHKNTSPNHTSDTNATQTTSNGYTSQINRINNNKTKTWVKREEGEVDLPGVDGALKLLEPPVGMGADGGVGVVVERIERRLHRVLELPAGRRHPRRRRRRRFCVERRRAKLAKNGEGFRCVLVSSCKLFFFYLKVVISPIFICSS